MPKSVIEVIARGVLIHAGKLLLCRNCKHGHRFLPGGHIDPGEPARAALEREIREELGIALRAGRFLGVSESSFRDPRAKREDRVTHEINLVFQLEVPDPDTFNPASLQSQEDAIAFDWVGWPDFMSSLAGSESGGVSGVRGVLPSSIVQLIPRQATATHPIDMVSDMLGT